MGFLPAIVGGLLGIGGSMIGANAQKHAAQTAADQQQQLQSQAYQQQLQYIQAADAAARQAFQGLAGQGNPYFQARSQMAPPSFLGGGQFGPQASQPMKNVTPQPQVQAPQAPPQSVMPALPQAGGQSGGPMRYMPSFQPGTQGRFLQ